MNWFLNLKIGGKLALGFGLCLLMAAVTGGVSLARMADMNAITQRAVTGVVPRDIAGGQVLYSATRFRVFEFHSLVAFLVSDGPDTDRCLVRLRQLQQDTDASLGDYGTRVDGDEDRRDLESVRAAWADLFAVPSAVPVPLPGKS